MCLVRVPSLVAFFGIIGRRSKFAADFCNSHVENPISIVRCYQLHVWEGYWHFTQALRVIEKLRARAQKLRATRPNKTAIYYNHWQIKYWRFVMVVRVFFGGGASWVSWLWLGKSTNGKTLVSSILIEIFALSLDLCSE